MPQLSNLPAFVAASLALLVVPGPAVLYIVARSGAQGRAAGVVSVLGVHTGTVVHVVAAVVGLSALISTSAAAFTVAKIVGGVYLIYLGVRTLTRASALAAPNAAPTTLRRVYFDGVVVNVLNPKTSLFFLAFLPQFTSAGRGPAWSQILVLGLIFIGLGLLSDGVYALAGARIGLTLRGRAGLRQRGRYVEGGLLVGLGVAALTVPHRPSS